MILFNRTSLELHGAVPWNNTADRDVWYTSDVGKHKHRRSLDHCAECLYKSATLCVDITRRSMAPMTGCAFVKRLEMRGLNAA